MRCSYFWQAGGGGGGRECFKCHYGRKVSQNVVERKRLWKEDVIYYTTKKKNNDEYKIYKQI
jgi:hypothetical protein